jgi:hypothetical protein
MLDHRVRAGTEKADGTRLLPEGRKGEHKKPFPAVFYIQQLVQMTQV